MKGTKKVSHLAAEARQLTFSLAHLARKPTGKRSPLMLQPASPLPSEMRA